jgi:type VI secretion system secreted protein VgrG
MAPLGDWEGQVWMANNQKRQSKLLIDLGGEQIDLIQLKSSEAFSLPFHISIDMLASLGEIDLMPHLGKPATVSVYEDDVLLRHFHGIVTDGEFLEEIDGTGFVYRLTMRPKAYLHEQGRKFRIFQMKSTREIIKNVLEGCGISPDFGKLKGGNRKRKYCVQYGESDFSFVSRLMEEEGIYYFYAHAERDHVLTICDSPSAHGVAKASPLTFNPSSDTAANVDSAIRFGAGEMAYVQEWRERVETGGEAKVTLRDWDFQRPNKPLEALATLEGQHPDDAIEVYDYPGRYYIDAEGKELAESLLAARRANRRTFSGSSKNASLACGTTFTLKHPDNPRYNGKYVLTRCQHSVSSESYRSDRGGGGGHIVDFEAVPADTIWKSLPITPRPAVRGPETAIVTGPAGEEIHCDEFGRVKIQFHWDREGKKDDHSSCYVRVSQTGGLGNMILPRVGQEVLVDFINGDPDRPMVVGRVYNQEHQPYYKLPDHKTRAVWRTKSYKNPKPSGSAKDVGSGDPGANELLFEDMEGDEEVYIHAQRNMNTRIQRDETNRVGNDQVSMVGQNRWLEIGKDDFVTIDENRLTKIKKSEGRTIGEDRDTVIEGNELLKVTKDIHIEAGGSITLKAGSSILLKVGNSTIEMTGQKIVVKSMTVVNSGTVQSQINSGAEFIQTMPGMAIVKGTMVMINSGGAKASDDVGDEKKPMKAAWLMSPPKPEKPKVSPKTQTENQSNKQD